MKFFNLDKSASEINYTFSFDDIILKKSSLTIDLEPIDWIIG